jgi:DNA-binding response OmpR family regulator
MTSTNGGGASLLADLFHITRENAMPAPTLPPIAIVIEPHAVLADTVAEALRGRGYDVFVAATHAGGAQSALDHAVVDFLIAAVPAPGEDRTGAYLARARDLNPNLSTVVMLSDPDEDAREASLGAIRLVKPFTLPALDEAIGQALAVTF